MTDEPPSDSLDELVLVPPKDLSETTLHALLVEFVTRDGTDYGERELALETKVRQLHDRLMAGEVVIVYHAPSEQVTLMRVEDLPPGIIDPASED